VGNAAFKAAEEAMEFKLNMIYIYINIYTYLYLLNTLKIIFKN